MASACVNNIGMSTDKFPATYPSYGWLSPQISFSRELADDESSKVAGAKLPDLSEKHEDAPEPSDPDFSGKEFGDFEFRLKDPVTMLPADELFSDGKLVPLQRSTVPQAVTSTVSPEIRSPDAPKNCRRLDVSSTDPYLYSPKAPRCSSRWKEILGLGLTRLHLNNNAKQDSRKTTFSLPLHSSNNSRSLKNFLHRNSKSTSSAIDSSLILPLLKDSDSETVSLSSRLSLSISSSGHDHDDLPRLSLDSEKPNFSHNPITLTKNSNPNSTPPRVKVVKHRENSSDNPTGARIGGSPLRRAPDSTTTTARGVSVDSPRMNSSGKIVFQGLERSSSSPSSFNGGPRFKHRGMERSYSANVRVTPVLNVPVCSLRGSSKSSVFGFQIFSSTQKREGVAGNGIGNRGQQISNSKNRTERA
ncbi:Membrane-associated kinase regulator [Actinidia chinensis var. chinensis]|uniref:Membrane-associated kinase regulator n=1 Tax=Actinidia chinensis var. chinensis TaxID=1590841 RepID=A0A2R6QCY0_ACTCC|nr:Membrane-associated kinase regulator [Actinidia chinensis var. chinensis]